MKTYFPLNNHLPIDATLEVCCQTIAISMRNDHFLVSLIQTFTARTRHATSTDSNHSYFPRIPNLSRKVHSNSFFLKCWYLLKQTLASILLWTAPIVIYTRHPLYPFFLPSLCLFILYILFMIITPTVTIYIEWLSGISAILNWVLAFSTDIKRINSFFRGLCFRCVYYYNEYDKRLPSA